MEHFTPQLQIPLFCAFYGIKTCLFCFLIRQLTLSSGQTHVSDLFIITFHYVSNDRWYSLEETIVTALHQHSTGTVFRQYPH